MAIPNAQAETKRTVLTRRMIDSEKLKLSNAQVVFGKR